MIGAGPGFIVYGFILMELMAYSFRLMVGAGPGIYGL